MLAGLQNKLCMNSLFKFTKLVKIDSLCIWQFRFTKMKLTHVLSAIARLSLMKTMLNIKEMFKTQAKQQRKIRTHFNLIYRRPIFFQCWKQVLHIASNNMLYIYNEEIHDMIEQITKSILICDATRIKGVGEVDKLHQFYMGLSLN